MKTTNTITEAIARSASHDEIVIVEAQDWATAKAEIAAENPSSHWDYSEENSTDTHRVYDCYGYADESDINGDMDWRIQVRVPR